MKKRQRKYIIKRESVKVKENPNKKDRKIKKKLIKERLY